MPEYITKDQAYLCMLENWDGDMLPGDYDDLLREIPPADVIDRAELCAKLMSEFNVIDLDEDTGECILLDQYASIIDVIDSIDGLRAEGAESIWGNDARTGGEEE